MKGPWLVTVGIMLILVVLIGLSIAYKGRLTGSGPLFAPLTPHANAPSTAPGSTDANSARTPPAGALEYHNARYHFSLFYPTGFDAKEYVDEKGGGLTVTFTATDGSNQGFQIFAVPYQKTSVTPERVKQDLPSGVVKEQTPVTIDGASATMFFSTNAVMGETREVWFVNKGILYEVNTYKPLDAWLSSIMATWKFI